MPAELLERRDELARLQAAVADAAAGRGSVAVVSGEAGIGKSSLVRAFLAGLDPGARVLAGACDDLLAPRALGPLHDAARGTGGPLERALAGTDPDGVFDAVLDQLGEGRPAVLVVEDLHWADDATLDVLRFLVRRVERLPALVVLTVRDEAMVAGHPVQDLLGVLAGSPTVRLELAPLSARAVAALAASAGRTGGGVHAATGGNPFYVTETLAASDGELPASVADAVLARLRPLDPECVAAVEQLSVVPTAVDLTLAQALLGRRLMALAPAEARGIVTSGSARLAFRHELARRAVEASLPRLRRRALHLAVVQVLRGDRHPDVEQLVHHAVAAGDTAAVAEFAPRAGRAAAAAGSHRQALAHLEAAVAHLDAVPGPDRARLVDDYAWELYIAYRFDEAVAAGREAVDRYERHGDPARASWALVRLARYLYITGAVDEATDLGGRAVDALRERGPALARAAAMTNLGALLTLTARTAEARPVLEEALTAAIAGGQADLESICLNYRGFARADLGEPAQGEADLRTALAIALEHRCHEAAARAYVNLGQMLFSFGGGAAFAENTDRGNAFVAEHGLGQYSVLLQLHRAHVLVGRGEWDAAEGVLRRLAGPDRAASIFDAYVDAELGTLLVRRGRPEAADLLDRAWRQGREQRMVLAMTVAGAGFLELAALTGEQEQAREAAGVLLARIGADGWAWMRGHLLRKAARAGLSVEPFDTCPEVWAAGLRGDWRAAAEAWRRAGDPYERALELAESGEVGPTLEALEILDGLGAAAATPVRRRLRELGVTRPPRPPTGPRPNPGGLTERQLDVFDLVAEGLTNQEIAERLDLSVRTVDHHVAAILGRLGARTRREAVSAVHGRGTPR